LHRETDPELTALIGQMDAVPIASYGADADIAKRARRKLRVADFIRAMHVRMNTPPPLKITPKGKPRPKGLRRKRAALALSTAAVGFGTAGMVPPSEAFAPAAEKSIGGPENAGGRRHARTLSASEDLREAMIQEEGVRQRVYRDVAGYLTVGIGHLVRPDDGLRLGQSISRKKVLDLFDEDIALAEAAAARLAGDTPLLQHEFDALVDLVYNVGEGNVSPDKSPRLNEALANADYSAIAAELDYTSAKGKVADGLVYRSIRRANIFLTGEYSDPRETA